MPRDRSDRLLVVNRNTPPRPELTAAERKAGEQALETVIKALGGQDAIKDTLAIAPEAPEVEQLVCLLHDPAYAGWSLKRLCTLANLTVVDLFAAYKKAMVVKAHLAAYQVITARLLPVVEDVMRRAAPYQVPCADCAGQGKVIDPDAPEGPPLVCPTCLGQGRLLVEPDLDRQKLALELGQLVQKSTGINVQQNVVAAPAADAGQGPRATTLVDLQRAVRETLRGPRPPLALETLDAQVVDPDQMAPPLQDPV